MSLSPSIEHNSNFYGLHSKHKKYLITLSALSSETSWFMAECRRIQRDHETDLDGMNIAKGFFIHDRYIRILNMS